MIRDLRVVIVGPLAPPAGGMAGQTLQLLDLLTADGIAAEVVRTNAPYRPRFVGRVRGVRAAVRLVPYAIRLWSAAGRASVFHVMANSGWAWHLFAAPAICVGKLRGVRVIVNYRGGLAESFLAGAPAIVRRTLGRADAIAVPSEFLRAVFARSGIGAKVIPNIVDLKRFAPASADVSRVRASGPRLVIARNLEQIYDIPTALNAFARVAAAHGGARLVIAGSGPERAALVRQAADLGLQEAVEFAGDLDRDAMANLYRSADIVVNSSIADNAPNFILEALACGKPVVSTDAGGIPFVVRHRVTALLVPPRDPAALADAVNELLADEALRARLVQSGLDLVQRFSWQSVRQMWLDAYRGEVATDRGLVPTDGGVHR
jgi:glycosyltransferase involved in cell wall biosynthesis